MTHVENFTRDNNHDDDNTASVNADAVEESASSRSEKPEYSVTFFTANVMGDIIVSSTWSVRRSPEGSGQHTIASIGIGYLPKRLFYVAGRLLCSCCLRRRAIELTEIDLNDIATAAESIAKQDAPVQQRPPR